MILMEVEVLAEIISEDRTRLSDCSAATTRVLGFLDLQREKISIRLLLQMFHHFAVH